MDDNVRLAKNKAFKTKEKAFRECYAKMRSITVAIMLCLKCLIHKKNKIFSILLALTLFLIMLYSAFFIAAEVHHDCIGEDCQICYQISICQDTLKKFSLTFFIAVFLSAFIHALYKNTSFLKEYSQNYTLVSLKVKLSD